MKKNQIKNQLYKIAGFNISYALRIARRSVKFVDCLVQNVSGMERVSRIICRSIYQWHVIEDIARADEYFVALTIAGFKATRQTLSLLLIRSPQCATCSDAAAGGVYPDHAAYWSLYSQDLLRPGFVSCTHCNCSSRCDIASCCMYTVIRCGILSTMVSALIAPRDRIRTMEMRIKWRRVVTRRKQRRKIRILRHRNMALAFSKEKKEMWKVQICKKLTTLEHRSVIVISHFYFFFYITIYSIKNSKKNYILIPSITASLGSNNLHPVLQT